MPDHVPAICIFNLLPMLFEKLCNRLLPLGFFRLLIDLWPFDNYRLINPAGIQGLVNACKGR